MALKVAFQMDFDIDVNNDVTVLLIKEAQRRGHQVFYFSSKDLSIKNNVPFAYGYLAVIDDKLHFHSKEHLILKDMNMIFIRQNPPFDIRYITTTYILEHLCDTTLCINNPIQIRNSPEKLLPLYFSEFMPPTLISENLSAIEDFYNEYKDVILKPLYCYGGTDVVRVTNGFNIEVLANLIIDKYKCPLIAQKFCNIYNGDKRVIFLNGKILQTMKRIPINNDIRANTRFGSKCEATELTDREHQICEVVGKKLLEKGLIFTGIDILDDMLIEINVTSPCGIIQMNNIYNLNLEKECWDGFEEYFESKAWKH